jgi:hypothetical protein
MMVVQQTGATISTVPYVMVVVCRAGPLGQVPAGRPLLSLHIEGQPAAGQSLQGTCSVKPEDLKIGAVALYRSG